MQDYRKWDVTSQARALAVKIYKLMPLFPPDERYALCQQLRRACVSIGNNIAEGAGRTTAKDKAHFLTQAIGSASEVEFLLDISVDLGFLNQEQSRPLAYETRGLKFRIFKLRSSVLSQPD
ncbi:four helix bundle protein [bacterium]|nr:four helix bundle protein [bacterium]